MGKDPNQIGPLQDPASCSQSDQSKLELADAEATLKVLADVFGLGEGLGAQSSSDQSEKTDALSDEDRYRTLVDQLPAVVFMASLDKGTGHAYVSPQIE